MCNKGANCSRKTEVRVTPLKKKKGIDLGFYFQRLCCQKTSYSFSCISKGSLFKMAEPYQA